jgi:hypothetical protein
VESAAVSGPDSAGELISLQVLLGRDARDVVETDPWTASSNVMFGGCFEARRVAREARSLASGQ